MISITEIAATVGYTVEDESKFDLEKFKEHLSKTYTPTETILKDETIRKRIVGKVLGSLATKAAQEFELKSSEVDGKPLEEIFNLVKNRYSGIITELTNQGTDGMAKRVEELELLVKTKEATLEELQEKLASDNHTWQQNMNAYKLSEKLNRLNTSIHQRLTDDYHKNELVKKGFDAYVADNYLFELDDKETIVVKDKATGKDIPNKNNGGQASTPEDILLSIAETKGILKKNNAVHQKLTATKQRARMDTLKKQLK